MSEHDLVIRGGTVIDGTGAERRGADVAKPQLVFAPAEGPGQGRTA